MKAAKWNIRVAIHGDADFETIFTLADVDKVRNYCLGDPSDLCCLCNRRVAKCEGHNVGLDLEYIYWVPEAYTAKLTTILNNVCLAYNSDMKSMMGCCSAKKSSSSSNSMCACGTSGGGKFEAQVTHVLYKLKDLTLSIEYGKLCEYIMADPARRSSFNNVAINFKIDPQNDILRVVRRVYPLLHSRYVKNSKIDLDAYTALCNTLRTTTDASHIANFVCKVQGSDKNKENMPMSCKLNGKTGEIRGHIINKVTSSVCRAVITADNDLQFGEIGISRRIGRATTPVTVMAHNLEYCKSLLASGQVLIVTRGDEHTYIYSSGTRGIMGEHVSGKMVNQIELQKGDIIQRLFRNGDPVLYNRQPTLHTPSLVGGMGKLTDSLTIGIHSSITAPLGADFDGDEMNVHFTVTPEAKHELHTTLNMFNAPIIAKGPAYGPVFHDIFCLYAVSRRLDEVVGPLEKYEEFLPSLNRPYTYRDVLSSLFPSTFSATIEKDENCIEIRNGRYIRGYITKSNFGISRNSILHRLYAYLSNKEWARVIDRCTRISNVYMRCNVMSPTLRDIVGYAVDKTVMQKICDNIVRLGDDARRERVPFFKDRIETQLESQPNLLEPELKKSGLLAEIVKSGARGNEGNLMQIMVTAGLQYAGKNRVDANDLCTIVRRTELCEGFVSNGYADGLTLSQFLVCSAGCRLSIVKSRSGVYEFGELQNKLSRAYLPVYVNSNGQLEVNNTAILTSSNGGLSQNATVQCRGPMKQSYFAFHEHLGIE